MARGWIALGFAAGYVVGTAAGRKQFERIKSAATDVWNRPEVQKTVKRADGFVAAKAPAAHDVGAALVDSMNEAPSSSGHSASDATAPADSSEGLAPSSDEDKPVIPGATS
ncbi:MAG: hypothetical protein JWM51_1153 [Microbacteriaceae bacterium]|jgi:hypothetical protein|nr:hypothetical protein [Microbacteriaceae bacterium]